MPEQSVLDEVRDRLVAGVPRYERRKRRRVGIAATAIVVLTGAGVASQVVRDSPQPVVVSPSTSTPAVPPGVRVEHVRPAGVAATLVATSGNAFGLSYTDLRGGTRFEYLSGTHGLGPGAVAGAVVTAKGDLLIWQTGQRTQLFPNFVDRGLAGDGVPVGSMRGERKVVGTEDGAGAWIFAAGDGEKTLEFVDLDTREVRLLTTVPAGSGLVGTRGNEAIVEPNATVPADFVTLVARSGDMTRFSLPEPASLVAMSAKGSVWIAGDGKRLLLLDTGGQMTAAIPAPFGRWTTTGHATIPSNSPDFRTMTADGERVLLALTDPDDINGGTRALAVANLAQRKADVADVEGDSFGSAFWADDDDSILIVDSDGGEQQTVTEFIPRTADERRLEGAVPRGYFVIAAG